MSDISLMLYRGIYAFLQHMVRISQKIKGVKNYPFAYLSIFLSSSTVKS